MYEGVCDYKSIIQPKKDSKTVKHSSKIFGISDFDLSVVIGSGKFGRVYLAKEKKSDLLVAIKIIGKQHIMKQDFEKQLFYEVYCHSQLKHPNITRMYTYFHDNNSFYFVLEYACNGSLYKNMRLQKYKRFTEDLAAKYIYQTADALNYCHSIYFFHGDVKPENILIDTHGNIKLSDFGLAWPSNGIEATRSGLFGTRDYLAPEQFSNEPYDEKIDHWSLGVMCFELLVGRSPFASKRREVTVQRILNVDIKFPKLMSEGARDLICSLVTYHPNNRLSLECVMNHKWVRSNYNRTRIL